jgi:dTDP-glucose 4,6-dehydratase/UDP-glucose 4-epimerase
VTIRPFNTFGPRQSARAVIPTTISQILAGKKEISLGALTPTRDFTYVSDTAEGLIAGASAPDGALGQVINLGTGYEISIGDLVALIANITGRSVEIRTDQNRLRPQNSEVERLLSDNRRAKELLGWMPKLAGHNGLRAGLERTITWFSNPENLSRYKTDQYNL